MHKQFVDGHDTNRSVFLTVVSGGVADTCQQYAALSGSPIDMLIA